MTDRTAPADPREAHGPHGNEGYCICGAFVANRDFEEHAAQDRRDGQASYIAAMIARERAEAYQQGLAARQDEPSPALRERLRAAILRLRDGDVPGLAPQDKNGAEYVALWLATEFRDVLLGREVEP